MARTVGSVSRNISVKFLTRTKDNDKEKRRHKKARVAQKIRASEEREVELPPHTKSSDDPQAQTKVVVENSSRLRTRNQKAKEERLDSSTGLKAKYLSMVVESIFKLKSSSGSSYPVILNQLKLDFAKVVGVNENQIRTNLKLALKFGLDMGVLKMAKESGKGSGSYKLTDMELKKLKKSNGKSSKSRNFFAEAVDPSLMNDSKTKNRAHLSESFTILTPTSVTRPIKTPDSFVRIKNISVAADQLLKPSLNGNESSVKLRTRNPITQIANQTEKEVVKTPDSFVKLDNVLGRVVDNIEVNPGSPSLKKSKNVC